jgi:hypothetical protein
VKTLEYRTNRTRQPIVLIEYAAITIVVCGFLALYSWTTAVFISELYAHAGAKANAVTTAILRFAAWCRSASGTCTLVLAPVVVGVLCARIKWLPRRRSQTRLIWIFLLVFLLILHIWVDMLYLTPLYPQGPKIVSAP